MNLSIRKRSGRSFAAAGIILLFSGLLAFAYAEIVPVSTGQPVSVRFQLPPASVSKPASSNPVSVRFPIITSGTYSEGSASNPVSVRFPIITSGTYSEGQASRPVSVVFNALSGLWKMDNNWQDSSGNNNNGTASGGAAFDPIGKSGNAGSFNGTDAYIDAGSSGSLRPLQALSVEAWIRINPGSSGSMYIAGNTDETTMTGYGLVVTDTGVVQMKIGTGAWAAAGSTTVLVKGLWYHVTGTYDGEKVRIYVNGVKEGEISATGIVKYNNSFRIGYRPGTSGAGYFSGQMDELYVFSRMLTSSEISARYVATNIDITPPAAPTVNPVTSPTATSILTLSGTKEADSSIWVNGTKIVNIDSLTTWQGAYSLIDGLNSLRVISADSADNQSPATVVAVIYDNVPPVIQSSIPANNSDTANLVRDVTISLSDTYSAINLSGTTADAVVKNTAGQMTGGSWIISGSNSIIFTPSEPFPQDTYTVTIHPLDALGNRGSAQITFSNHDLTPPVSSISLSGTLGNDSWYSTEVTVTLTATDGPEGIGVDKTEYSLDGTTWNVYTAPFVLSTDGIATVHYRSVDKAGNQEVEKTKEVKINTAGIVARWKMDNNWNDSSFFGNNGTAYNGAIFSTNTKAGSHSGSYDGLDDYVNIPSSVSFNINAGFTVEAWFNKADDAATASALVSRKSGWSTTENWYLNFPTSERLCWGIGEPANGTNTCMTFDPVPNTWYHAVGVYDNGTARFYINGVLQGSDATVSFINSNLPVVLGRMYTLNTGYYFKGLIDEVTIYNRALSAEEIQANYLLYSVTPPTADPVTSPTASQTIILSGTKEPNRSVLVNGSEIYPIDDQTTWSGTYTLQSGPNTLNITAKDPNSYQSQAVSLSVILDNAAPVVLSSAPANNTTVAQVASVDILLSDAYSAVDLQTSLSGALAKNSSGAIVDGIWRLQDGHIIFNPASSLDSGTYTVTIYPADSLGNFGTASITFVVDKSAPVLQSLVMSPASPHKAETVTLTFAFSENMSTSTQPVVTFGKVSPFDSYSLAGSWIDARTWRGSYNFSSATGDGLYKVMVSSVADSVGNVMQTVEAGAFELDTVAPLSPSVNAVTTPTKTASQTLSGTKESGSAVLVNGVQRIAHDPAVTWSYTVSLSEGQNNYVLIVRDAAGNDSSAVNVSVVLDTAPPLFTVDAYNSRTRSLTETITGRKEPGSIVRINDQQIFGADDMEAAWSYTLDLSPDSNNHFVLTASDAMSNTTTRTVDIYSDRKGPVLVSLNISQGEIFITPVTITATASDSYAGMDRMELYLDGAILMSNTGGSISYYWDIGISSNGSHLIKVAAYDQLGNVTEESRQVYINHAQVVDLDQVLTTAIDGDYLYTAHGSATPALSVFSLNDPLSPVLVSTYGLAPVTSYSAGASRGLGITWPNSLASLAYDGTSFTKSPDMRIAKGSVLSVYLREKYGLYSAGSEGWGFAEMSDDGSLTDMGAIKSGGLTKRAVTGGGYILSADGTDGIRIYEIETGNAVMPLVSITSPVSGAVLPPASEVEVIADVANGDSASVTFFVNGAEMFVDDSAPYSYRFHTPAQQTTLVIRAIVYNLNGLRSESGEIAIEVR